MNKQTIILLCLLFCTVFLIVPTTSKDDFFSGTWCIGDERLIISFTGGDSLQVTSLRDESINGRGTYEKKDSTLIATLVNDDLELKMGYRYKKKSNSRIRAKIVFFTVDGDSVNHPNRWMRMERCNPEAYTFPEEEGEGTSSEDKDD